MSDDVLVFQEPSLLAIEEQVDGDFILFETSDTLTDVVAVPGDMIIVSETDPTVLQIAYGSGSMFVITSGGPIGPQGPAGPPGTNQVTSDGVAGMDLSGHRVVVATDSGFIYADSEVPDHANRALFLTMGACMNGDDITVLSLGSLEEPTWTWTTGQYVYLGTGGSLSSTIPVSATFCRVLGSAESATRLQFDPQPPIILA